MAGSNNMLLVELVFSASSRFVAKMEIGPSGVRALPLAAGINVGGHYKGHFFLLSLSSLRAHC
jgi:hypothetical protein